MKHIIYSLLLFVSLSCKKTKVLDEMQLPKIDNSINDSKYVVNKTYKKGDVRRYGVYPNQPIIQKNLSNIIALASEGLPMTYPKGVYKTSLVFNKISHINFIFKEAIFSGGISILDGSSKLKFDGQLTVLDKLFIRKSNNILFDRLIIKTDTVLNVYHKKNRGVSIYAGSKKVSFNCLKIEDTGGTSEEFYKYTAASLQIHGWNNNPEQVYVNKLEINKSGRTALYITGKGHQIEKVIINNFGLGSAKNMFGLEDASAGEEKEFSGAWINRCNDCVIDTLEIISNTDFGKYSLRLHEGLYHEPTFINNVHFKNKAKELSIDDDELTNILVKNEY